MSRARKAAQSAGIGAGNLFTWWARKAQGPANVLEINLSGRIVEDVQLSGLWQRVVPSQVITMADLLSVISLAAEDKGIKVLFLRVCGHELGWGRAAEVCEAVQRFRAAGKYALAYLEEPENVDTMIAASCDRIVMPPGMPLFLTGLLSEVMYFKGIMDKLDIKPELFQAGKYKSAVEPYTRPGMSKEHREAMNELLDGIYSRWVGALASGRGLDPDRVRDLIDQGPWMAEDALDAGLVDALVYEDEIDDYIEKWLGLTVSRLSIQRFIRLYGPRAAMSDPWKKSTALAIITASGAIHGGESRFYGVGDTTVGSETLRRALRDVLEDDRIGGVVLRVDSPGGSAVHSDLIWREVERLARVKPVVASMADVAASGGYYIAMPADHIVASPTTLTGSIGVIGGRINLQGLYAKVGIKKEKVSRGKHADIATDYGALSPELRRKLKKEMETVYRIFVEKAARGRKKDYDELESSAQGRVWTGEQARGLGLVDELGNLMKAIERTKERAGIPIGKKVPVFTLPRIRRISFPGLPIPLPIPGGEGRAVRSLSVLEHLSESPVLALMPFLMKIK